MTLTTAVCVCQCRAQILQPALDVDDLKTAKMATLKHRLSDHHKRLSQLTVVCTLLHREKDVRMHSYDKYDASLHHLQVAALSFFPFLPPTLAKPGVLLRGFLWTSAKSSTTRSMSTPQTTP